MMLLVRMMLVLALALVTAPVHGQDLSCQQATLFSEQCPNPKGLRLSLEELHEKLRAHKAWFDARG